MLLHTARHWLRIPAIWASLPSGQRLLGIRALLALLCHFFHLEFFVTHLSAALFIGLFEYALVVLDLFLQILLERCHSILHVHLSYYGRWGIIAFDRDCRRICGYMVFLIGICSAARVIPVRLLLILLWHVMILILGMAHFIAWRPTGNVVRLLLVDGARRTNEGIGFGLMQMGWEVMLSQT